MTDKPSSMQTLFAEMKRRSVFKVMAVYGAVAFAALQLADLFIEPLGLPLWTMNFLLLVALVGFPIAIVLAWAFETTPQGVRRTERARPEEIREIVSAPRSHRWPAGLLALAGMSLLFATGWWMGAGRDAGGPVGALVQEAGAAEIRALAALPFENVNGDEENRILAIGLLDDLLAHLSRIDGLRVTSRTSVNEYEETDKALDVIAGELGVDYILEGSVRRSGDRVRVTVTLVDASTDERMWTEQYDRDVTPDNLFDLQSDIARRTVAALETRLTPEDEERLETMEPASDLAAQSWYYRGLDTYGNMSLDEIGEARDALARAVTIDPNYVAAWSWLAQVESRLVFIGDAEPERARMAMERTVELAPSSLEAHLARGFFEYYANRNFEAARSSFEAAVRLAPSDANAAWSLALIHRREGNWDESTALMKRAAQLDPRNVLRLETLAENHFWSGAFTEADRVIDRTMAIDPTGARARSRKVEVVIELDGHTRGASRLAAELALDSASFEEGTALEKIARYERDFLRVIRLVDATARLEGTLILETRLIAKAFALARLGDSLDAVVDTLLEVEGAASSTEIGHPSLHGYALALAGRRDEARRSLQEGARRVRAGEDHVLGSRWAAHTVAGYGALGELDPGIALLEEVLDRPHETLTATNLRLDPEFDPYRADPRFDGIVDRRVRYEAENARKAAAGRPWVP